MKAFLRTDYYEDPDVINELKERLAKKGIALFFTQKRWQNIVSQEPFLYFRNAYVRFDNEENILGFAKESSFKYIKTSNDEVICANPSVTHDRFFSIAAEAAYIEPKHEALPILMATHNRADYLRLTLNSLFYNTTKIPDQKFYIIANDPDEATRAIVNKLVEVSPSVEAVVTDTNVGYGVYNFGAKFFDLEKFIIFEDDGVLPESFQYLYPHWTRQLNYRSKTGLAGLRISEQNRCELLWREVYKRDKKYRELSFNEDILWNYYTPTREDLPPISGLGLVIDSPSMYRDFRRIGYFQTDLNLYYNADQVCISTVPVYHIGANQVMDYGKKSKSPPHLDRFQAGTNIRSGERQTIDLLIDWQEHHDKICAK